MEDSMTVVYFVVMGVVALFAIAFGIWFHIKFGKKKPRSSRRATAAAGNDLPEEFLAPEDNSLPDDDDDGEFRDTNLFGMKTRGKAQYFKDWN